MDPESQMEYISEEQKSIRLNSEEKQKSRNKQTKPPPTPKKTQTPKNLNCPKMLFSVRQTEVPELQ